MSIQKITFEGVLNYLATKKGTAWNMLFQASQFDVRDFGDLVNFGHLKLNLSPMATRDMELFEDHIYFKIRKHGIVQEMNIPYTALMIIQDPDDPSQSMPWPYFLDHGDDYTPDEEEAIFGEMAKELKELTPHVVELPNTGVKLELKVPTLEQHQRSGEEYAIKRLAELGINITPEQMQEHARKMHESMPEIFDAKGNVDLIALANKAQPVRKPTLSERIEARGWTVIEGGNVQAKASMPFIDEVHRAKQARREQLAKLAPDGEVVVSVRSDGSNGNSVFFPDLDVSKCYFPTSRKRFPSWMTVIQGGK